MTHKVHDWLGDLIEAHPGIFTCTCETCGDVGRLFNDSGYFLTACDQHANGQPVAEKTGWENVTISRVDADGSKTVIVKRRHYVRETDSFVEIDSLIIEGGRNSLRLADLWIFGHTHESEDVTIGYTRQVSNAKGYGPSCPNTLPGTIPSLSRTTSSRSEEDNSIPINNIRSSS